MRFKSFQSRLSTFFTGLLILVLFVTFWVVNQKNIENAEQTIMSDLEVTADAFNNLRTTRIKSLFDIVGTATRDFAFLRTVSTRDEKTIVSAIENNIIGRIFSLNTQYVIITDLDGQLIASNKADLKQNPWPWLLDKATDNEFSEADGVVVFEGQTNQVIVLPIDASGLEGWVLVSFAIDSDFAKDTRDVTKSDLSVIIETDEVNTISASSLPAALHDKLNAYIKRDNTVLNQSNIITLGTEQYISLAQPLADTPTGKVSILLQGSLDDALQPYKRLNRALISVFLSGLFFALLATLWLSRSISRPLKHLSESVQKIGAGDYKQQVNLKRQDELGQLAESVNHMAQGLQEKEQVRDLLGKVVSNEIATELLSKELELGGEEKEVTILFADLRNFTAMCEGATPSDILDRLNRYFNVVSSQIEMHGGVVDKYIGDAIMALYGAPVSYPDSPQRAVKSAHGMLKALTELNKEFAQEDLPTLNIGIGINSGKVVAGNMGSESRLNYTVIGDAVNIAARLESLCKEYAVPLIVSESSMRQASDYKYRKLDDVTVKGKQESIAIFTPVGLQDRIEQNQL